MFGLGTSPGIGVGKAYVLKEPELKIVKENILDIDKELEAFHIALNKAISDIEDLYIISNSKIGIDESGIFLAHRMILEDPEFIGLIIGKITKEKVNSAWAVSEVTNYFVSIFQQIEDEYLKERALDLVDVSKRLLMILLNISQDNDFEFEKDTIIIARDLTPSNTVLFNPDTIQGIVTEWGGRTCHTSILARNFCIPAICGVKDITSIIKNGDMLIINGDTGEVILNPNEDTLVEYVLKKKELENHNYNLNKMIGKKSLTKDGCKVDLSCNIGSEKDIDRVLVNDGEGVGLFRTEFIYMDRDRLPSEEEQFIEYKKATERLGHRSVVIRTLDIGGDKDLPYLNLKNESNPYLGLRGIRFSLERPDIFKTQIRAILRASDFGNFKIMFPMISDLIELRAAKKIIEEAKVELRKENIKFNDKINIGMMVELPSAAIHSSVFAKEVDFFSIGTNDLIQYTLGVDRGNNDISHLYTQYHPAVLSLINMTIKNGHSEGISVGICGEASSDELLIPIFIGMGIDELSMSPSMVLKSRKIISNTNKKAIEANIDKIINLETAEDVKSYLESLQMIN